MQEEPREISWDFVSTPSEMHYFMRVFKDLAASDTVGLLRTMSMFGHRARSRLQHNKNHTKQDNSLGMD